MCSAVRICAGCSAVHPRRACVHTVHASTPMGGGLEWRTGSVDIWLRARNGVALVRWLSARLLPLHSRPVQMKNRTYTKAKPGSTSESAWVQELNDCILKVAGLDMGGAAGRPHGADSPSSSSSDDNEDGGELPAAGGRGRGQPGGALPPPGSGGSVPGGRGSVAPGRTPPKVRLIRLG
eukprot:365591-Chlamydomonas_euryale.AAC.3